MIKATDCMEKALATFKERNVQYGDSYTRHGEVMHKLFPTPLVLKGDGVDAFNRLGVLNMIVSKLVRYCQNFNSPHIDSIHDLGVYAFILEELDTNLKEKETK